MEKYLSELNQAQLSAVLHKDGALMVIAGAGSGKTKVLTYRIAYLISQGVDPFNILSLTFTNKAAREMRERITGIVGSASKNLWMGTFHSVFAKILRIESDRLGYPSNFSIYDQQDSYRLVSAIIKEMNLDKDIYKYKDIFHRISSFKNNLITPRAYFRNSELMEQDAIARRPRFGDIYQSYVDRCFKSGAMDFDDLLLKTNELFTVCPDVLFKYQNRFKYILVDEYQDTNHSQYLIVRALSDKYKNICVVGDDAQSIYAFRGANIQNIFNFQSDYTDVSLYRLEQNYRSTKTIVGAANSIIENNKDRLEKVVWTNNEYGDPIGIYRTDSDFEEGRFVASTIENIYKRDNCSLGSFSVLYRTNRQSRSIEEALRKRDIPYRIYGGISFYQRKEIKDILAYFRLVVNPSDEEAIVRVINFPARGIGSTTLDKLSLASEKYKISIFEVIENMDRFGSELKISSNIRQRLEDFATMIRAFQIQNKAHDAFYLAENIVKKTGIMLEMKKDTSIEGVEKLHNVEELLNGIRDFVDGQADVANSEASLSEFLEDVALDTDFDKDTDDKDKVSLMTVHLAKGLEFPFVFIVGMEENLFPSAMSINSRTDLEEERRLFYVALTRAEKKAFLSYAETRLSYGKSIFCEPSRFIFEIKDDFVEFSTPVTNSAYKPLIDFNIFQDINKSKLRLEKPKNGTPPTHTGGSSLRPLKKLRLVKPNESCDGDSSYCPIDIKIGDRVSHQRFGNGLVVGIEGSGYDTKAIIKFDTSGEKSIILRFSKLTVI